LLSNQKMDDCYKEECTEKSFHQTTKSAMTRTVKKVDNFGIRPARTVPYKVKNTTIFDLITFNTRAYIAYVSSVFLSA
jgi:hypothetical protein